MKSWNGLETIPLVTPPRPPTDKGIRIRALVATLATCMLLFGLNALFTHLNSWVPPRWGGPPRPGPDPTPFAWSEVRFGHFSGTYQHMWCASQPTLSRHGSGP